MNMVLLEIPWLEILARNWNSGAARLLDWITGRMPQLTFS